MQEGMRASEDRHQEVRDMATELSSKVYRLSAEVSMIKASSATIRSVDRTLANGDALKVISMGMHQRCCIYYILFTLLLLSINIALMDPGVASSD